MKNLGVKCLAGLLITGLVFLLLANGCSVIEKASEKPRLVMFVGIDMSGSFYNTKYFEDAMEFLSIYLYAHINGLGGLKEPKKLFVGGIGAENANDPRVFRPIHDFLDKTPEQIRASLKEWYPKSDQLTDFNVFFEKVASIVKKENLVLSPVSVVLISDGIQDLSGNVKPADEEIYKHISFEPLEFLARNMTLRLLYTSPKVADGWDNKIIRRRVKLWTKEAEVMSGWRHQYKPELPWEQQDKLWQWIQDNVDFRVINKKI